MKKTTIAALEELTELIGCKSYTRTSHRCTGKWRGTTDYGICFDNGFSLPISNGMKNFEGNVREHIAGIKTFHKNREEYVHRISRQLIYDNSLARQEGLSSVNLIDVGINTETQHLFLWCYALIEVGGKRFKHTTSNINYYMRKNRMDVWMKGIDFERASNAGGINEPDYIFGGFRFSSTDNSYKIPDK